MTSLTGPTAADDHRRFGLLPWLLPLFAASGCSALIYEIVWFQLLQLVIGSSAVSISVLLGTFMGGMCLGSLMMPRLIATRRHPLKVYAVLEFSLGIIGLAVVYGMPALDRAYGAIAGVGLTAVFERGILCAVCLMPPTILMGATLPALARFVEVTPRGVSWLGLLYGINILGAVVGCLAAGFYLLRVHNMAVASCAAAGLNGIVALVAYALAIWTPHETLAAPAALKTPAERGSRWVYVAIALSGATALAAEVVWTRLLALLLGATVYTFSIILAVFLLGLALGGAVGSLLARISQRPALALAWCQFFLAGAIAWSAYALADSLPYWPIDSSLLSSPWLGFQLDIARCLWAVLPAACLWGASFPLALAAVPATGRDSGKLVGAVYAANTIGAILGAVLTSLLLIPWLGSQQAQRVLIVLSSLAGLCVLLPRFGWADVPWRVAVRVAGYVAVAVLAGLLVWSVPPLPWKVVAFGRYLLTYNDDWQDLYVGEGLNSSVAVTQIAKSTKDKADGPPVRNFHVSGKVEASTEPQDMRLQRMLGHLPALLQPRPRTVLVVGCGAGVTAGSFVVHPEVEKIVICEIEPLVPKVVAGYFGEENHHVLEDPRVEVVYDDARHYVRTTNRTFDIITSDPIHPWVKGSATLYTKEYFEMCKRHLNPGGIVTQWVPLYESNLDVVKSEMATFFDAFPEGTVWENDSSGEGYDVVLLGQQGPITIDADALQERLQRADHAQVAQSLKEVGFNTVVGLLGRYGGRASDLQPWLAGAQINRDVNLRLQYLAGLGLNENLGRAIRDEMLPYRRYPEDLFVGTGLYSVALRKMLAEPPQQGSYDMMP